MWQGTGNHLTDECFKVKKVVEKAIQVEKNNTLVKLIRKTFNRR